MHGNTHLLEFSKALWHVSDFCLQILFKQMLPRTLNWCLELLVPFLDIGHWQIAPAVCTKLRGVPGPRNCSPRLGCCVYVWSHRQPFCWADCRAFADTLHCSFLWGSLCSILQGVCLPCHQPSMTKFFQRRSQHSVGQDRLVSRRRWRRNGVSLWLQNLSRHLYFRAGLKVHLVATAWDTNWGWVMK